MKILGLHFGHDAAACIVINGEIKSYVMRERQSRTKHAIGLTENELILAFAGAGICWDDIDAVAVSTTQGVEIVHGLIGGLEMRFVEDAPLIPPTPLSQHIQGFEKQLNAGSLRELEECFVSQERESVSAKMYERMFPEGASLNWSNTARLSDPHFFFGAEVWVIGPHRVVRMEC